MMEYSMIASWGTMMACSRSDISTMPSMLLSLGCRMLLATTEERLSSSLRLVSAVRPVIGQ